MIYHSTQSDVYLWLLIICGKQNEKKKTKTPKYKIPPHFQWSEQ